VQAPSIIERSSAGALGEWSDAGQLAGVAADLGGIRHDHRHQFEVAMRGHCPDGRAPDVARTPHHDPQRI
jgi:hypothetical protein